MNFDLELAKKLFSAAKQVMIEREIEFSKLDAATGDGDHGTAIKAAVSTASDTLAASSDLKQAFFDAGFATMSATSGSTSTLFGSLLMGFSDGIADSAISLDAAMLCKAFESGLENVKMQTKANIGDKTMMDALIPAVESMKGAANLKELFDNAAKAAKAGAEATVNMQAKFGRARNLAEKSIGVADAGATSMSAIFEVFSKSL